MILLNSVLVSTDFGDASEAALTYGRNLARAFGAKLYVLHVVDDPRASAAAHFHPDTFEDIQQHAEEAARYRLDRLLTTEERAGSRTTVIARTSSTVADAIVACAKETAVDMIVVGTHGRGPVSHFFL